MTTPVGGTPLRRAFFERTVLAVARDLLGSVLISRLDGALAVGRIVETEAYAGMEDPASHAVRLSRSRLRMAGLAGLAYVHRSYGLHDTLNVVTGPVGEQAAVLIRAVEPLDGLELIRHRRAAPNVPDHRLLAGPGNLARGMGIGLGDDGRDLTTDGALCILPGSPLASIHVSPRIGITRAADWLWRFYDPESRSVSAHRRGMVVT